MQPLKPFTALLPIKAWAQFTALSPTQEYAADKMIQRRAVITVPTDTVEIDWERIREQEAPPPGQSVRKNEYIQYQMKEMKV